MKKIFFLVLSLFYLNNSFCQDSIPSYIINNATDNSCIYLKNENLWLSFECTDGEQFINLITKSEQYLPIGLEGSIIFKSRDGKISQYKQVNIMEKSIENNLSSNNSLYITFRSYLINNVFLLENEVSSLILNFNDVIKEIFIPNNISMEIKSTYKEFIKENLNSINYKIDSYKENDLQISNSKIKLPKHKYKIIVFRSKRNKIDWEPIKIIENRYNEAQVEELIKNIESKSNKKFIYTCKAEIVE